jgi:AcrR family transcriptional regulator
LSSHGRNHFSALARTPRERRSSRGQEQCAEIEGADLSRIRTLRRQHILNSALQTFLRDGYHAATMDRVAEDACVSKQTLYNYFEDKEDLFITLIEERKAERLLGVLDPALELIAAGEIERGLCTIAEASLCSVADGEYVALFRLLMELATEVPGLRTRVHDRIQGRVFLPTFNRVREALDRAVAGGHLRPVNTDVAARAFFGVFTTSILLKSLQGDECTDAAPPEHIAAGLADILSHGLVRDP